VLRDLARSDSVELVVERIGAISGSLEHVLDDLAPRLRRAAEDPEHAALHGRRTVARLVRVVQANCLLRDGREAAAALIGRHRLTRGWDPERDSGYRRTIDAVLAET
jgi:hypothetical protein